MLTTQDTLRAAQYHHALHNLEVSSRVKGGRIALPENWLWRLLYPDAGEVIESDCEKESENIEIVSKYAAK